VTGTGERHEGRVYAYDPGNARILAYEKAGGKYVNQYRLAKGTDWSDLRGMYVLQGAEEQPATLIWLSASGIHQAVLAAAPEDGEPGASGSPAPSGASPSGSAAPSTQP
jgi:hypothetical protein